ncbi:MAG: gamma-glutamylcyclotransferase, partial [Deltaproteobacteria bacterium]|nr:gamma-glutamylcyclotransferase [Deltaproteobacteria bacterium]
AVFCYGSLRAPEVIEALLGAPLPARLAWHPHAQVRAVRGEDFPALALLPRAPRPAPLWAPGELLTLAPPSSPAHAEQLARLDAYEEVDAGEYVRAVALVWALEGAREGAAALLRPAWAWCYLPGPALRGRLGGGWRFEERDALLRARGGWGASPSLARALALARAAGGGS